MGMYNEVFKTCPKCGHKGYMQIMQIVLGFGGFDLDNFDTLDELTEEQLYMLHDEVRDHWFKCENNDCGDCFQLNAPNDKKELMHALFNK